MRLSPHYAAVKAGALDILLCHPHQLSSRASFQELCQPGNHWRLRNAVGVTLCQARDEVIAATRQTAQQPQFNIGNFRKAQREIVRLIRQEGRAAEQLRRFRLRRNPLHGHRDGCT